MAENEGLKREIGTWGLAANSINIIIGAGIFILPVVVAERLGTGSIWAYGVCGSLMLLIMLCFAEAGTLITRSGGAYSYIEIAFGKYVGFLTTNIFIFGASVMANAAVANGLADTLGYFFPVFKLLIVRIILFATIFGGLAYLNVIGVSKSIMLVKITTIAKLAPLILIAVTGLFFIDSQNIIGKSSSSISDLGEISLILLFAFVGAETALNVGGEIKKPEKTIPRGIILSILVVVFLYILIQISVQGILGEAIGNYSDAPLAEISKRMIGPIGATLVLIGASFSMFGNLSGMVLNMPRVLFASARDKVLPPYSMAKVHEKFNTPYISVIVYSFIGFVFSSIGEFKQLAMLSSESYLLIYLGVVLSVVKFRLAKKEINSTYRFPGGYMIPVISSIVIIWMLSNLPFSEIKAMGLFILVISALYIGIKLVSGFKAHQP